MKHLLLVFLSSFLLLLGNNAMAQNDCPAYSPYSYFEESCFISANTAPTGQKMGGIWLPEASFDGKYGQSPNKAHIPDNRKTWAISIAHAWNYSRNILKQTDHPKMSYWMATVTQESEWRCDGQAKWGSFTGSPVGIPWFDQWQDGCYQIEGSNNSSAYGLLMEYYPLRFKANEHSNLIGDDNFETSALVKAYYDLASERIATYRLGWKWNEAVNNACDPYAHEKLSASAYNAGIYGFQSAKSFMTNTSCYWSGLPSTTTGYPTQIGDLMAVLENNTTYPISTFKGATSTFDGYYSAKIAWSDLEEYFAEIAVLYHEINFQTQVIPNVEKAFIEAAGSKQDSVSFTALGSVIDALILSLPKEDPMQIILTTENIPKGPNGAACSGDVVPVATIKVEGKTSFEEGLYTKLVADFNETKNYTLKWKLNDKVVGTEKELIVSKVAGTYVYGLEICDGTKCSMAECEKTITIENVTTTCNLAVTTAIKNAVCQTSSEGKIIVNVQNGSGNYDVNYWLNGKQYFYKAISNTFTLDNLTSGIYGIEISDLASKSCKINTNATVSYTTASSENLMISKNKATDCGAILTGELTTKPSAQKWRIKTYVPVYFLWENWINLLIQTKNTTTFLQADEEGLVNSWEKEGNYYDNFMSGDSITISALLTNNPGAIQNYEIKIEFYNEQNELKETYTIPANTLTSNTTRYKVGTYTIQNTVSTPIYMYQWTPLEGVQNPTSASTVVSAVNPLEGKYMLTATNPTNACTLKDSVMLTYNCLQLCKGFNVEKFGSTATYKVCAGGIFDQKITATGLNLTYQWYKNNKEFNNQTETLSITNASAKNEGLYYLKVKDACNQEDVTHNINVEVDICTDIETKNEEKQLVYPNPTNGKIIVGIEEEVQTLSVYSIDGKLLIQKNNSKEINLNEYSSGIYLLEIQTFTGIKTVKIYKK